MTNAAVDLITEPIFRFPIPEPPQIDLSVAPEERYELLGHLARGGMAELLLTRARTVDGGHCEVALKQLLPQLREDPSYLEMFYDEARIAMLLKHPGIPYTYDAGVLGETPYIAMEFLRGVDLAELRERIPGRRITIGLGLRIAIDILGALHYAHSLCGLKIVHRDVSPQNVFLSYDGTVKLLDFGVARASFRSHETDPGLVKGKLSYMAPEQLAGLPFDHRADIFALAELLYEALLNRHPFEQRGTCAFLDSVVRDDPVHPCDVDPEFPPELAKILVRALRKRPEERYASAWELRRTLEDFARRTINAATEGILGWYVRGLFSERRARQERTLSAGSLGPVRGEVRGESLCLHEWVDIAPGQERAEIARDLTLPDWDIAMETPPLPVPLSDDRSEDETSDLDIIVVEFDQEETDDSFHLTGHTDTEIEPLRC